MAFRSSEIDSEAIWDNLGGKLSIIFFPFFYDKGLHLPRCYVC